MNAMKRKAEENLSPSTPDTQKGWLRNRRVPSRAPNSLPDDPPSPSPTPRTSQDRMLGADSSWVQLGGISQAGQISMSDESGNLWISSSNNSIDLQASTNPATCGTSPGDSCGGDSLLPLNNLLQNTLPSYNDKSNVPSKDLYGQKQSTLVTNATVNEEVQDLPENRENSVTRPIPEPRTTTNDHNAITTYQPMHSQSFPIIMLPTTNPDRPLRPGDEVHLLDPQNSDHSGQITYKITSLDPEGLFTISPLPTSLRCPATRLLRAPLMDGDIVSVFQPVVHIVNGVHQVRVEQADWGAITKRWVVDGERRYNVVSWDGKWAGRIWEGLRDGDLGQYEIGDVPMVGAGDV